MLRLTPVTAREHDLLFSVNQKYLYEMTNYYPDDMDENGNYHYGYFESYFTDPKRMAFLIYNGTVPIGFAMINPYSYLEKCPDHVLAEFCIFPSYRRKHFALEAVDMIFNAYPGTWEIKYNEMNTGAKMLWKKVTAPFSPTVHRLNAEETVLEFKTNKNTSD